MNAPTLSPIRSVLAVSRAAELPPSAGRNHRRTLASLGLLALACVAGPAWAQTVPLGTAASFGVLGGSAVTNTGATIINANLGISPNGASSVTGFPPGIVLGTTHFADAVALQAQNDVTTAYNTLAGRACGTTISGDLGGSTRLPGVYCSASSIGLTGTVTLDAQGDPNAVFIFQVGSTLTTASASRVLLINGASSCNVFFQVGSSATLGTGTAFVGSILALQSITVTTGSSVSGRLLARNGAVTLDGNAVSPCGAAVGPPGGVTGATTVPTLSEWMLLLLAAVLVPLGAIAIRRHAV